jgi:hypothetical protein
MRRLGAGLAGESLNAIQQSGTSGGQAGAFQKAAASNATLS